MAYPKALSEKSIQKMLEKEGITEQKSAFLHQLFLAGAKLYGVVSLEDLWTVYKETAERNKYPKITKKQFTAFSLIARREDLIYRVYEIDELYDEKRSDMLRLIILKDLKARGGVMMDMHYVVTDKSAEYPLYIPEDILSFAEDTYTKYEKKFLDYLGQLPCRLRSTYNEEGRKVKNENFRRKLKEISYADETDRFMLKDYEKGMKTNPGYYRKLLEELRQEIEKPVSLRIFENYVRNDKADWLDISRHLSITIQEIIEKTGNLKESEMEELAHLMTDLHNHTHLYSMHGWSPEELRRQYPPTTSRPQISFGPNIRRMIEEGTYDRDELERMIREAGFEVFDPDKHLS